MTKTPRQEPKRSSRLLLASVLAIVLGVVLYIAGVNLDLGGSDSGAIVGVPGMILVGVGLLALVYALFVYLRRAR